MTLFSHDFILILNVCLGFVDFLDNLTDAVIDLFVCLDFLCRVDEEYVCASSCRKRVLLIAPAFAYSALQEVAFDSPFEHLLGH